MKARSAELEATKATCGAKVMERYFQDGKKSLEIVKKELEANWACTEVTIEIKHLKMALKEAKEEIDLKKARVANIQARAFKVVEEMRHRAAKEITQL